MSTLLLCTLLWAADAEPSPEPTDASAESTAANDAEATGTEADTAEATDDIEATDTEANDEPAATESTGADTLRVVVPDLEAQGVDPALAASLTNVLLTRLSQLPHLEIVARRDLANLLDQEKQRQLVGCGDDAACLSNLAGALDATRLLTGSVGKVGERYLLSLALLDTSNAKLIRRVSREALLADSLVTAANEATVALWASGEIQVERCVDCDETRLSKRWVAAVKVGNNFSTFFKRSLDVEALSLGLDIDVGYRVWTSVALFGSVGLRLNSVERTEDGNTVGMQVMPLQFGVRYHTARFLGELSAYVAGAVGLGFLRTRLEGEGDLLTAFSGRVYGGLVYALGTRVGALAEISYEVTAKRSDDLDASRLDAAVLRLGLAYGF